MNKNNLLKFIQKYSLGGLIESVAWNAEGTKLSVRFISDDKTLLGEVEFNAFTSTPFNVGIYTTLVGMTTIDTNRFIDLIYKHNSQIKVLCIHLPDKYGNMRGWKYTEDYKYSLSKVITLQNFSFFQAMTMNKNAEIHDDIKQFNIKLVDWNTNWSGHTRANSLTINSQNKNVIYLHTDHQNPVSCASTPFYDHNVLLPNGDVVLCCMDYSLKHIIGNLFKNDYDDLYLSNELIKIMKENKKVTHSKCSICKSCDNAKVHNLFG